MKDVNPFKIEEKMVLEIIRDSSKHMKGLMKYLQEIDVDLKSKLKSEIFSKLVEINSAKIFSKYLGYEVIAAKSDRDPDLYFTKLEKPLEVKITVTKGTWTGGEFSKRTSHYLLISRSRNFDKFFVTLVFLKEDEWESSMEKGYNFYGPRLSKKYLYGKDEKIIFLGGLVKEENRKTPTLIRESINSKNLSEF